MSTVSLACTRPKAPKEFNLFWLTSLPQSFAPLEYTTLLRLQTNQQLVDLLFTILSTMYNIPTHTVSKYICTLFLGTSIQYTIQ